MVKPRKRARTTGCKGHKRGACAKRKQCKMTKAGKRKSYCRSRKRSKRRMPKRGGGRRRRRSSRRQSWSSWF